MSATTSQDTSPNKLLRPRIPTKYLIKNHSFSGSTMNSAMQNTPNYTFNQLKESIDKIVASKENFNVIGLGGQITEAAAFIEKAIEQTGMTCRIYASGRLAGAAVGSIFLPIGIASAIGIAAHNIVTYDPDYEIAKHVIDNKLVVTYKKVG